METAQQSTALAPPPPPAIGVGVGFGKRARGLAALAGFGRAADGARKEKLRARRANSTTLANLDRLHRLAADAGDKPLISPRLVVARRASLAANCALPPPASQQASKPSSQPAGRLDSRFD